MKKLLLGLGVFLLGACTIPVHAQSAFCTAGTPTVSVEECEALVSLYTYTNGNNWAQQTGWIDSYDIGTWYGVTVEKRNGVDHVVGLSLTNNNVTGGIPTSIEDLPFLETVKLNENGIISLPEEIGSLSFLAELDISDALLVGLPDGIGSLTALKILKVDNNNLTSLPNSFGGATQLDYLSLSHNALTGIPVSLDSLDELDYLDISYNVLTSFPELGVGLQDIDIVNLSHNLIATLDNTILDVKNLSSFDISYNGTTSIDSAIGQFSGMEIFISSYNAHTELPGSMQGLGSLSTIYIDNNLLTVLPDFSGLANLQTLYANNNVLTELPESLGVLSGLRYLYLQNNSLLGAIPETYTGMSDMRRLYLNNNALDRLVDHTVAVSNGIQLWLDSIYVKDLGSQRDETSPELLVDGSNTIFTTDGALSFSIRINENSYSLDLLGNGLPGFLSGPGLCSSVSIAAAEVRNEFVDVTITLPSEGLYSSCSLTYHDHAGNSSNTVSLSSLMRGNTLADFCALPELSIPVSECMSLVDLYSSLGGTAWTNSSQWFATTEIEEWFGIETEIISGEEHVTGIYLHKSEGDDGYGVTSLWQGNNLVGSLPVTVGDFSELQSLHLTNNTISGPLPASLGTLSGLEVLYLAGNDFTGSLPSQWQGLVALKRLVLNNNLLGGVFPSELVSLSQLEILNISNNGFSGEIPSYLPTFSGLVRLNLAYNQFTGAVPQEISQLLLLDTLLIQENALDRDVNKNALLSPLLQSRVVGLETLSLGSQRDETAPIISGTGTVSRLVEESFDWTLTIDEKSYAVNSFNQGMEVLFGGSTLCEQLSTDLLTSNTGSVLISIDTGDYGLYENCELTVQDHGYNISNSIILPTFGKAKENHQICYNPDLTISIEQCLGLVEFYEEAGGDDWLNTTGWLSSENVSGWYGITTDIRDGENVVVGINLSTNNLVGTLSLTQALNTLEILDVSGNWFQLLSVAWSDLSVLSLLDISSNQLSGLLLDDISSATNLKHINLSSNQFTGSLPESWAQLLQLESLDLSVNTLDGSLPQFLAALPQLKTILLMENVFTGKIPQEWINSQGFEHVNISQNSIDRDATHNAVGVSDAAPWVLGLQSYDGSQQEDKIAPTISWVGEFPSSVDGIITLGLFISEGSYAVTSGGEGMPGSFQGSVLCESLDLLLPITTNDGQENITIIPTQYGSYEGCALGITDHGGNTAWIDIPGFEYSVSCGNGIIEGGEDCDEGRFCADGSSCTDDISKCPFECQTRFKEGCNPECQEGSCGDGYVDIDGPDMVPQTGDDEFCDEGRFCNDGTPCTNDPSVCSGGIAECQTRFTQSCSPYCSLSTCGDGFVDRDGPDNILDTADDELCDDGNYESGDGCSNFCALEGCGDGIISANEQCDLGQNNGLLGSNCSSTCTIPGENCAFCYETCDGGDGNHSLFLLIDVSGSMGSDNKIEKAKTGAKEFITLVEQAKAGNSGFETKIGIIAFESTSWIAHAPSTNYQSVRNAVDALGAGGGTNFGDALFDAHDYFENNDTGFDQHVILLSDGLPTSGGGWTYYPEEWAEYAADALKDDDVSIYTISVELSTEGVDLMRKVSSSPIQNVAYNKTTYQSSTYNYYSSWKARDGDLSSWRRAQTYTDQNAWWQIDLGALYNIKEIRLWNRRGSYAWKSSDYKILMSENYMGSSSLSTTLAQQGVSYIDEPGQMQRPSYYNDIDTTLRYLRVQLDQTQSLSLAEVEILGCPNGVSCEDVYNYEDYQGDAIDLLYSHIFGAIHCGCKAEKLCGVCGDGFTQDIYGEDCDEGSTCNDGTDCTTDPGICPGECFPKQTNECTGQCVYTSCGDSTIQSPNHNGQQEQCDDGNGDSGDGCTSECVVEFCGDGFTDSNGPDNIWFTGDDEACDPNDPGIAAGCLPDCTWNPAYLSQDGTCGGEEFIYNVLGDGSTQPNPTTLCGVGTVSDFQYDPEMHQWNRYCLGIYGGEAATCTTVERYCGDGLVQQTSIQEQCEDGNQQAGDGCSDTCLVEQPLLSPEENLGRCLDIQYPIIQNGEFVPLGWNLDAVDDVDIYASSCDDLQEGKFIPGGTLQCQFSLYRGTPQGAEFIKTSSPLDCIGSTTPENTGGFVFDFFQDYGSNEELLGYALFDEQWNSIHPKKGKYHIQLESISYDFCGIDDMGNDRVRSYVYDDTTVCHFDYGVTSPYLTQQGSTFGSVVAGPVMNEYTTGVGTELFIDGAIDSVDTTELLGYNTNIIRYLFTEFVDQYKAGAIVPVYPFGSDKSLKKVPTKSIYFYVGNGPGSTVTISEKLLVDKDVYTLIVINADLVVEGSLSGKGLHIVLGGKTLFTPENCDLNDRVQGMFLSEFGFESPLLHNNNTVSEQWCSGGGFILDGLLLGPDSEGTFLNKRRAQLNLFETSLDMPQGGWAMLPQNQRKLFRKEQGDIIMNGSAVRIKANTSSWNELPEGAAELFNAVEVWR